jgi:hypothetical protein
MKKLVVAGSKSAALPARSYRLVYAARAPSSQYQVLGMSSHGAHPERARIYSSAARLQHSAAKNIFRSKHLRTICIGAPFYASAGSGLLRKLEARQVETIRLTTWAPPSGRLLRRALPAPLVL